MSEKVDHVLRQRPPAERLPKLGKNIWTKKMSKRPKSTLKLVAPLTSDSTAPPADLGEPGRDLWRSILREFRVEDAPSRQQLLQICHAADMAADAHGRGMLKEELQARAFITRALRQMNFDVEPSRDTVGRPTGMHNPTR